MTKPYLRTMEIEDLEMILEWRNHPAIRAAMFTKHEISIDEHRQWFNNNKKNTNKEFLIFINSDIPTGFINLTKINIGGIADWGFYVAPNAPKGSGSLMGQTLLQHAFKVCGFHKLCGQVLQSNKKSIDLHNRLGFQQEGILRDHHYDGENYHTLICFGLLKREWVEAKGSR